MQALYVATAWWDDQPFGLIFSEIGMKRIILPHEWMNSDHPDRKLPPYPFPRTLYARELKEYWAGTRTTWSMSLDMDGTPFQRAVWQALQEIPYGQTRSYQQVAQMMGRPDAVRAVARAIGMNPLPVVVPCHRVVGSNGTLTGFRGGLSLKSRLLTLEGVSGLRDTGHPRFRF